MSTVAVVRCEDYDTQRVEAAVGRALELLGGIERFVRSGERIVLKPNLLVGAAPDDCVTTHPAVFEAVARRVLEAGATVTYGDSPGFGSPGGAARKAGIAQVAERLGVALADFTDGRNLSFPAGTVVKGFFLANGVIEADGLISLPKFKTHGLTRITGAVKNQFGCIVGMRKGEFHARMPDLERFCAMLVDLNRLIAPRLVVTDAIIAMEGNGPRSGDPRHVGAIIASSDPVAVDATLARIATLDPALVGTITAGERLGLGTASDVTYVGDPLEAFVVADFRVNRSAAPTASIGRSGDWFLKRFLIPKPVIREDRCTACGTCVTVCPVTPKAVDWAPGLGPADRRPPRHDHTRCIRCYCCQEMCPERAIEVDVPLLGRLIHKR